VGWEESDISNAEEIGVEGGGSIQDQDCTRPRGDGQNNMVRNCVRDQSREGLALWHKEAGRRGKGCGEEGNTERRGGRGLVNWNSLNSAKINHWIGRIWNTNKRPEKALKPWSGRRGIRRLRENSLGEKGQPGS